jgi:hypothetical protein
MRKPINSAPAIDVSIEFVIILTESASAYSQQVSNRSQICVTELRQRMSKYVIMPTQNPMSVLRLHEVPIKLCLIIYPSVPLRRMGAFLPSH